jgi:hypothetical protein
MPTNEEFLKREMEHAEFLYLRALRNGMTDPVVYITVLDYETTEPKLRQFQDVAAAEGSIALIAVAQDRSKVREQLAKLNPLNAVAIASRPDLSVPFDVIINSAINGVSVHSFPAPQG